MDEGKEFRAAWSASLGRRPLGTALPVAALREGIQPFYLPKRPTQSLNSKQIERQRMQSELAAKRARLPAEARTKNVFGQLEPPQQRSSDELDKYAQDTVLFEELLDRVAALRKRRRQKVGS